MAALLVPWILARQIQPRSSLAHAVAFFVMCLSISFLSLPFLQASYVYEWDFKAAWLAAAVAYVLIQAGVHGVRPGGLGP